MPLQLLFNQANASKLLSAPSQQQHSSPQFSFSSWRGALLSWTVSESTIRPERTASNRSSVSLSPLNTNHSNSPVPSTLRGSTFTDGLSWSLPIDRLTLQNRGLALLPEKGMGSPPCNDTCVSVAKGSRSVPAPAPIVTASGPGPHPSPRPHRRPLSSPPATQRPHHAAPYMSGAEAQGLGGRGRGSTQLPPWGKAERTLGQGGREPHHMRRHSDRRWRARRSSTATVMLPSRMCWKSPFYSVLGTENCQVFPQHNYAFVTIQWFHCTFLSHSDPSFYLTCQPKTTSTFEHKSVEWCGVVCTAVAENVSFSAKVCRENFLAYTWNSMFLTLYLVPFLKYLAALVLSWFVFTPVSTTLDQ